MAILIYKQLHSWDPELLTYMAIFIYKALLVQPETNNVWAFTYIIPDYQGSTVIYPAISTTDVVRIIP